MNPPQNNETAHESHEHVTLAKLSKSNALMKTVLYIILAIQVRPASQMDVCVDLIAVSWCLRKCILLANRFLIEDSHLGSWQYMAVFRKMTCVACRYLHTSPILNPFSAAANRASKRVHSALWIHTQGTSDNMQM